MGTLADALRDSATALTEALGTLITTAGPPVWQFLADHPQLRLLLVLAALALTAYWLVDGVRNWRRKCLPCRGRGSFNSRLSKRLDRPCWCCGGGGRHTTIRRRLTDRLRH